MRLSPIAIFVFTTSAFAASVRLDSEMAVSPIVSGAAAYDQTNVQVASNGVDYVATWSDTRQQSPNGPMLYATRLDNRGVPVESFGHAIAFSGSAAQIASDGRDYLIAYSTSERTLVQKLDGDGHRLAEARPLPGTSTPLALASNGQSYLLATRDSSYTSTFVLVDRDAVEIRRFRAPIVPAVGGLASRNGGYVLVGVDTSSCRPQLSCNGSPALMAIDPSGDFSVQLLGGVIRAGVQPLVAAFGSERILVASNTYQMVGYDGSVGKHSEFPFAVADSTLSAGWDGNEFLVAIHQRAGQGLEERASGIRVRSDGVLLDTRPFDLAVHSDAPRFAASSTGNVTVWSANEIATADVFSRAGSFADLESTATRPTLVTLTAPAQRDPDVAADSRRAATWIERTNSPVVQVSFDGENLRVAGDTTTASSPVLARGRDSYLLVWSDAYRNVFALRFATDGTPLSEQPLLVSTRSHSETPIDLAVAWNGETYLIVWSDKALLGRRMDDDGTFRDATPFAIVPEQVIYSEIIEKPSVVAAGAEFIVAASGRTSGIVDPGPWIPETRIWTSRVASSGVPDQPSAPSVASTYGTDVAFQVTDVAQDVNEHGVTVVWTEYRDLAVTGVTPCIAAAQTAGTAKHVLRCFSRSQLLVYGGQPLQAAIAWNGIEHVLAWSDAGRAFAMRFDRNLNPLDDEPIAVAESVLAGSRVRATASPGGVTIAYSRIDRAAGDVPRVFLRTLLRSDAPLPTRRRSARP